LPKMLETVLFRMATQVLSRMTLCSMPCKVAGKHLAEPHPLDYSLCGQQKARRLEQAEQEGLDDPPILLGRWPFSERRVSRG
jgi:hypothetical protein